MLIRNPVIVALGLIALTFAATANASKQENIGVGAGAIIGAAAGGPIGLIVGAAVGAKVGDDLYQKDSEIESLSATLQHSRGEVDGLERHITQLDRDIDGLSAELEQLQRVAQPELVSLLQAGIAMDLLFRTDEAALADGTGIRLNALATTLAAMPDIRVQLDGFADERGDEVYNQDLSMRRVGFVRDQLVAAGIDASRITAAAHGESPAQDERADSYALERRVTLKLFIDDATAVALTR